MKIKNFIHILLFSVILGTFFQPAKVQGATDYEIKRKTEIMKSEVESEYKKTKKLGSIKIRLEDISNGQSSAGVEFAIIQVAYIANGRFVVCKEFERFDVDFNTIQTASELEAIAKKLAVSLDEIDNKIITDEMGNALTKDLEEGVYLIVALDIAEYENINPCLVSIPTFDEVEQIMKYDIEVYPKHFPSPTPEPPSIIPTGVENRVFQYSVISIMLLISAITLFWGVNKLKKFSNKIDL